MQVQANSSDYSGVVPDVHQPMSACNFTHSLSIPVHGKLLFLSFQLSLSLTFMMNNCLLLVIGRALQAMNAFVAANHFLFMSLMSLLCKNRINSVWHPKIG